MKRIAILVPETAVIEAVADPRYLFQAVNQFLVNDGKPPMFEVELVAQTKQVHVAGGVFTINADATLATASQPDVIIIPAIGPDIEASIAANQAFFPWILQQRARGAEIVSLCIGAFLLAATGLLKGKPCSTHWLFAGEFKKRFPDVQLMEQKIVCEHEGVYSSGGANSYWNLLLHLVEKYTGREMAIRASKFFVLHMNQDSQSPFAIFNGQRQHHDELVLRVQDYVENNYAERITMEELALKFHLVRRTLERRFKTATNNSPMEYLQRVRIEAAKKLLESGGHQIQEIMFQSGYSDSKSFRYVFKKVTGVSPAAYRTRYAK